MKVTSKIRRLRLNPAKIVLFFSAVLILLFLINGIIKLITTPSINIESAAEITDFLADCGWTADYPPVEMRKVQIPAQFSEAYAKYNEMQKSQGFDLSKYKSEYADIYVFKIVNHPTETSVFANVIVFDGKIIGGDICSYSVNGFITGLKK